METDWAEDRAKIPQDFIRSSIGKVFDGLFSTPERDKFRTRLEQGKEAGTVEVTLDGQHRIVDVFIAEGALRKGISAVEDAVNEALVKANAEVDASASAASVKINEVVAEITGRPGAI